MLRDTSLGPANLLFALTAFGNTNRTKVGSSKQTYFCCLLPITAMRSPASTTCPFSQQNAATFAASWPLYGSYRLLNLSDRVGLACGYIRTLRIHTTTLTNRTVSMQ
jgi:hypothetical protein